jgi:hypothetical protein
MRQIYRFTLVLLLISAALTTADTNSPISGERFQSLVNSQQVDVQRTLQGILPESRGYFITGPLNPIRAENFELGLAYSTVRVICPDLELYNEAIELLAASMVFDDVIVRRCELDGQCEPTGYQASFVELVRGEMWERIEVNTIQQTRFLIWYREVKELGWDTTDLVSRDEYAEAVSGYLAQVDSGMVDAVSPRARDYGLPEMYDIYAPAPEYIISGYQNYKEFLYSHAEVRTEFANGILAFIPTEATLAQFKESAPQEAYPNKEQAMLQDEYREFFSRGGDMSILQTLTAEGFDTLKTGEYFFAVGLSGKIRFGRELEREVVARIEEETGKKVPRGNHAFLFPGEPVLTAGAFFIDTDAEQRLEKVNAQSGHYFYSNVTETIREDIAARSDHYLLTLGHFFNSLESLGIPHDRTLISKLN